MIHESSANIHGDARGCGDRLRDARTAAGLSVQEVATRLRMPVHVVQALDGKVGQEADEAGGIWADGIAALRKVFSETTISDIESREAEDAAARMYFI